MRISLFVPRTDCYAVPVHHSWPSDAPFMLPGSPEVPGGTFRDCQRPPRSRAVPCFGSPLFQKQDSGRNSPGVSFVSDLLYSSINTTACLFRCLENDLIRIYQIELLFRSILDI